MAAEQAVAIAVLSAVVACLGVSVFLVLRLRARRRKFAEEHRNKRKPADDQGE